MSKFQKRHYSILAEMINDITMSDGMIDYKDLLDYLCEIFRKDNPNFDEKRFRAVIWDESY
tara:strand:- start:7495 stop:7677 length:183 start_codon:yes stop_codon:yes gene_type:complete